jgi:hypothetical protein
VTTLHASVIVRLYQKRSTYIFEAIASVEVNDAHVFRVVVEVDYGTRDGFATAGLFGLSELFQLL